MEILNQLSSETSVLQKEKRTDRNRKKEKDRGTSCCTK